MKELQGQGLSRLGGHGHFPAVGRERHPDGGKSGWGCLGGGVCYRGLALGLGPKPGAFSGLTELFAEDNFKVSLRQTWASEGFFPSEVGLLIPEHGAGQTDLSG